MWEIHQAPVQERRRPKLDWRRHLAIRSNTAPRFFICLAISKKAFGRETPASNKKEMRLEMYMLWRKEILSI
jgi:hypothetical protein